MVSLVGGANLVEIYVSFLSDAVYLSPNFVGGIVGVGFSRSCVSCTSVFVAVYFYFILGKGIIDGKNYAVLEIFSFYVLGI